MAVGKSHVKKGDMVQVMSGEDKGKTGKVLEVMPAKGRIIVEGINIVKKHTKPTRQVPQGGVVEQPGPIAASTVMLVCPSCDKPTRVERTKAGDGSVARVCKRCDKVID